MDFHASIISFLSGYAFWKSFFHVYYCIRLIIKWSERLVFWVEFISLRFKDASDVLIECLSKNHQNGLFIGQKRYAQIQVTEFDQITLKCCCIKGYVGSTTRNLSQPVKEYVPARLYTAVTKSQATEVQPSQVQLNLKSTSVGWFPS